MTGEIETISKRFLRATLGVNAQGIAGLQGVNACPNLVALYGDSLIAQAHMDSFQLRRAVYNDVAIANALSGQRMIFAAKRAVSGWRSDQILQRFRSDVADGSLTASRCGTLIFSMGTNDIAQATTGFTDVVSGTAITIANVADNLVANAVRLIDTAISLGIQCIFRTIHGASNMNAAQIGALEDANRRIRMLQQGRRLWLVETRDALRDSLTTTASAIAFRPGHMASDPGPIYVHEGIAGAIAVGKRLAEIVKSAIPPLPSAYSDAASAYSANLPGELVTNPTFTGTSGTLGAGGTLGTNPAGGALAGVPTGWNARRALADTTTTFTANVGEDATGRYIDFVTTATTAAGGVMLTQDIPTGLWANGERLQAFSTVEIMSGAVNLAMACPTIEINGTGVTPVTTVAQGCGHPTGTAYGAFPSTEGFVFEDATEVLTVPDFTAKGYLAFRAVYAQFTAAGSATIRVRKPRFEKVADVPAIAA